MFFIVVKACTLCTLCVPNIQYTQKLSSLSLPLPLSLRGHKYFHSVCVSQKTFHKSNKDGHWSSLQPEGQSHRVPAEFEQGEQAVALSQAQIIRADGLES